jgi:hypothetical protein
MEEALRPAVLFACTTKPMSKLNESVQAGSVVRNSRGAGGDRFPAVPGGDLGRSDQEPADSGGFRDARSRSWTVQISTNRPQSATSDGCVLPCSGSYSRPPWNYTACSPGTVYTAHE